MKNLAILLTILILSFSVFAKSPIGTHKKNLSLKQILNDFKAIKVSKEKAISEIQKIEFPYNIANIELIEITNSNKAQLFITFGKSRDIASIPSTLTERPQIKLNLRTNDPYGNYQKILAAFKLGHVSKLDVIEYSKDIGFPYNVTDIIITKNKQGQKVVEIEISFGPGNIKRQIANIAQVESSLMNTTLKGFSIGSAIGMVETKKDADKINMNFLKVNIGYQHKLKNSYTLSTKFVLTKFNNIEYSLSDEQGQANSIYPEFGLKISKKFNAWSVGLAYDYLNYFVLGDTSTDIILTPQQIHRTSFTQGYSVNDRWSLFTSLGYLTSFSSIKISGLDMSLGASYKLMKNQNLNLAGVLYKSSVSVSGAEDDNSNALALSLSYNF
ncbi:MAG: hypothetical protein N4A33_03770 [Bacteriovoracaceae bacterium]|jgi:hypothetical protein|nr:hypothetical protein [Bacteriovoracaceae bacterium]